VDSAEKADKVPWVEMRMVRIMSEREFTAPLTLEKALQQADQ